MSGAVWSTAPRVGPDAVDSASHWRELRINNTPVFDPKNPAETAVGSLRSELGLGDNEFSLENVSSMRYTPLQL